MTPDLWHLKQEVALCANLECDNLELFGHCDASLNAFCGNCFKVIAKLS